MMLALMEAAAFNAVQPHLAATPQGLTAVARLEAVEGRRLLFTEAFDGVEQIGEGSHERSVVSIERFLARVRQKQPAGAQ